MFVSTICKFLLAGFIVRVFLACCSFVRALHCRHVRLGGVSLPKVGRLFASSCFVASI